MARASDTSSEVARNDSKKYSNIQEPLHFVPEKKGVMKSTLNHYKEVRSIYLYRRCRVEVKPEMAMLMTVII